MESFGSKAARKLHHLFWNRIKPGPWSKWLYGSYRKYRLHPDGEREETVPVYLTAIPNPGAGIGHQLSNWIAGLYYAELFGLSYATLPFSDPGWERLLGFSRELPRVEELKRKGYSVKRLPRFDGDSEKELEEVRSIIGAFRGRRIIFRLERDQFLKDLYLKEEELKRLFWNAPVREEDPAFLKDLLREPEGGKSRPLFAAVHIRRGDIGGDRPAPGMEERWISGDYFRNVLQKLLEFKLTLRIAVFSQGKEEDFPDLSGLPGLEFHLEASAEESFLSFAYADILVTSKSSFSYKPALLNRGLKLCPRGFWHGYPQSWVVVSPDGSFSPEEELKLMSYVRSHWRDELEF